MVTVQEAFIIADTCEDDPILIVPGKVIRDLANQVEEQRKLLQKLADASRNNSNMVDFSLACDKFIEEVHQYLESTK